MYFLWTKRSFKRPWNSISKIEIIWILKDILKCYYSKKFVLPPPSLWQIGKNVRRLSGAPIDSQAINWSLQSYSWSLKFPGERTLSFSAAATPSSGGGTNLKIISLLVSLTRISFPNLQDLPFSKYNRSKIFNFSFLSHKRLKSCLWLYIVTFLKLIPDNIDSLFHMLLAGNGLICNEKFHAIKLELGAVIWRC